MNMILSVLDLFSEVWVWLALVAALGYAGVGFIDEYLLSETCDNESEDGVGNLVLISGFFGLFIALVTAICAYIVDGGQSLMIASSLRWQAEIAGGLEVVWLIPYLYAVNRSGAMNVAPIFQAIPIFTLLIGGIFFSEIPTTLHVMGSFTIVIGTFLLNSGSLMDGIRGVTLVKMISGVIILSVALFGPLLMVVASVNLTVAAGTVGVMMLIIFLAFVKAEVFKVDSKTILLAFTSCAIIALVYFLFKGSVLEGNFIATAFWSGIGMAGFTLVIAIVWVPYRKQFIRFLRQGSSKALLIQTGNESLNTISVLASHMANVKAPSVMLASTFNCFHPIFTLVIGGLLAVCGSRKHQEHLRGSFLKVGVAILMIATGTVLISL